MHPLLRWGVFGLAIAGAFAGGYFVRNLPSRMTSAAEPAPAVVASTPPRAQKSASLGTVIAHPTVALTMTAPGRPVTLKEPGPRLPDAAQPTAEPPTILLPPVAVGEKPAPEPVDPNDPALRMIKDALNIKTTILDKPAPPPVVLADAKKDSDPTTPPPPTPMTGPPPKLDMAPPDLRIEHGPVVQSPPPNSVRLLNNRALELDFEVTKAGLSKVKAVELWTTRDGGTTWKQTDRMEGAKPPFRTRLGSEGEYGFRLVFVSEAGMRTPEPTPGQSPELVVELDTTPPGVRLYAPVPGRPGTVVLRWLAMDKHLDYNPAAARLEYSANGETWLPIDLPHGLPGGNSHEWQLPVGVPYKVLLRLTVRDRAGNVAVAVTNEKMSIDLVAPEGKLTGVRVQGHGPEPGPMPHEAEAGAAADGPVEGVLRSALAALLNSPLLFPALTGPVFPILQPEVWDVSGNEEPAAALGRYQADGSGWFMSEFVGPGVPFTARDWVAAVTKADVVEERPVWTYRRRDPFAIPALGPDLQAIPEPAPWNDSGVAISLAGRPSTYHRPLLRGWGQMTEQQFRDFLAEFPTTTSLGVVTDRDWQPSTARPEIYRCDGPTFGDRPFGGVFDSVPALWEPLPDGGVRLDF